MGYQRSKKIFKLVFEDPELDGLVVRMRSVSLGRLMKLMKVANVTPGKKMSAEDMAVVDEILQMFAKALVGWNLEEEDEETKEVRPVPATPEGVYSQDLDFVIEIITAWVEALAGVSAPLGKDSPSGETFPEGSLPMASLSASRAS